MRFILRCKACGEILNEIYDSSYFDLGIHYYEEQTICDRCKKNIVKLKKKEGK